jgi:hypothetical protein
MRVASERWDCQLIHAESDGDGMLIDLVALDACPFNGLDLPAGWPFVLHIVDRQVGECGELVDAWAESNDVVALRFVYDTSGGKFLHVLADHHQLILEIG